MSAGISEIPSIASSHVAAGHPFGIGIYIEELTARGLSISEIDEALQQEGLSLPKRSEVSDLTRIEEALMRGDYFGVLGALSAFRKKLDKQNCFTQLQCLRMRLEYRFGADGKQCQLLFRALREGH